MAAVESPTPSLVDVAMRGLPMILPVLDFSTIKNELFPVVATVFSKTNSLAIKVRGLQAFVVLCGGTLDGAADDGLNGFGMEKKKTSSSTALDKYTMQEKIVPLIKAIKTKEPAVMTAALRVLRVVGEVADADFVAMDILPILWNMSLGPLLNLKQFQSFMELIKTLSRRVEDEQTKKLQELSAVTEGGRATTPNDDFIAFGGVTGTTFEGANGAGASEDDFEKLVKGKTTLHATESPMDASWDAPAAAATSPAPVSATTMSPQFSWSTPPTTAAPSPAPRAPAAAPFRTVTPDLNRFEALTPSATQFSKPLQPTMGGGSQAAAPAPSFGWSTTTAPAAAAPNPWASSSSQASQYPPSSGFGGMATSMNSMNLGQKPMAATNHQPPSSSSFSLPPPPSSGKGTPSGFSLPPPPGAGASAGFGAFSQPQQQQQGMMGTGAKSNTSMNSMMNSGAGAGIGGMNSMNSMNRMMSSGGGGGGLGAGMAQTQRQPQLQQQQQTSTFGKSGLDKYESLI